MAGGGEEEERGREKKREMESKGEREISRIRDGGGREREVED